MREISQLVASLRAPGSRDAYGALKELTARSAQSDQVYSFFDDFAAMLDDPNSYVRTRGLTLVARNARWDVSGKLESILDAYLAHVTDEKPITARQCIQHLEYILDAQPQLAPRIRMALEEADFSSCQDSMSPLLQKDALHILNLISSPAPPQSGGDTGEILP